MRKKQQRLLKNMDAHKVMLDLLQIPYEKVGGQKLAGPEVPRARGGGCGDLPAWLGPAAGQGRRGSRLLLLSIPRQLWVFLFSALRQGDAKMMEILKFTHQFLQKFCAGNQENQALLHKHLNLFLTPGVRRGDPRAVAGSSTGTDFSTESKRYKSQEETLGEEGSGQEGRLFLAAPLPHSAPLVLQLLEAETMQHIFLNNYQLCSEINETVPQHFIHCVATHGRHVQYLDFLHTIIKAEGKYVKKCQDMIMTEVSTSPTCLWGMSVGHSRAWLLGGARLASSLREEPSQPCWLLPGVGNISRSLMQGPRANNHFGVPQAVIFFDCTANAWFSL